MPKLPEFREVEDGIDAYLTRFERYAENAGWEKGDYALVLKASCSKIAIMAFNWPARQLIVNKIHLKKY